MERTEAKRAPHLPAAPVIEWEAPDRVLTCIFECRTVTLSFVSYESHGKAASDIGE